MDPKITIHTCSYCKKIHTTIGIVQKETNYYSVDLTTQQWEDFHGDGSVETQEFFCISCNKTDKTFKL